MRRCRCFSILEIFVPFREEAVKPAPECFPSRKFPQKSCPNEFVRRILRIICNLTNLWLALETWRLAKNTIKTLHFLVFSIFRTFYLGRNSSESFVGDWLGIWFLLAPGFRPLLGTCFRALHQQPLFFCRVSLQPMSGWCSLAVRIISIISAHSRPFKYCQNSKSATSSHP